MTAQYEAPPDGVALPPGLSLMRMDTLKAKVGLSRAKIYDLIAEGKFPAPIHVNGTRVSLWPSTSIDAWIAEQMEVAHV